MKAHEIKFDMNQFLTDYYSAHPSAGVHKACMAYMRAKLFTPEPDMEAAAERAAIQQEGQ